MTALYIALLVAFCFAPLAISIFRCKHAWRVVDKTYAPEGESNYETTSFLLLCPVCGRIEQRDLPGRSGPHDGTITPIGGP